MKIIAGKYYHHTLEVPKGKVTRPSTSRLRESLFNILQQEIEGADFLDVFAGSGAIGIEALSRGACSSTFIESDREALQALKNNLKTLHVEPDATILYGDYLKNLKALALKNQRYDLIFADAPYHKEVTDALLEHASGLLKNSGKLFIENAAKLHEEGNFYGLLHLNSRKLGKSYLHQFQK